MARQVRSGKRVRASTARRRERVEKLTRHIQRRDPKTGRFVSKGTRGAVKETVTVQRGRGGRIMRAQAVTTAKTVRRTVKVPTTGTFGGHIGRAMATTNILSAKSLRDAKRVTVRIRGTDRRDKTHRFVVTFDAKGVKKLSSVLLSRVIGKLSAEGWRPQYGRGVAVKPKPGLKVLKSLSLVVTVEK